MLTTASDREVLLVCAAAIAVGALLFSIGCYLMPLRVARHWWHNR